MILETPVLTYRGYYYRCGESGWACIHLLAKVFTATPARIILHGSTRPSLNAVKVHLDGPNSSYSIDKAEVGAHENVLLPPLQRLANRFLEAGHKTTYLSMYECK